jgi:hypothetical protein
MQGGPGCPNGRPKGAKLQAIKVGTLCSPRQAPCPKPQRPVQCEPRGKGMEQKLIGTASLAALAVLKQAAATGEKP